MALGGGGRVLRSVSVNRRVAQVQVKLRSSDWDTDCLAGPGLRSSASQSQTRTRHHPDLSLFRFHSTTTSTTRAGSSCSPVYNNYHRYSPSPSPSPQHSDNLIPLHPHPFHPQSISTSPPPSVSPLPTMFFSRKTILTKGKKPLYAASRVINASSASASNVFARCWVHSTNKTSALIRSVTSRGKGVVLRRVYSTTNKSVGAAAASAGANGGTDAAAAATASGSGIPASALVKGLPFYRMSAFSFSLSLT